MGRPRKNRRMTTVELAQHIAAVTTISDVSSAPMVAKQELALIMTRAVAEFYALAPSAYRKTTLSRQLPDPEQVTVEMLNGSAEVVGAPFLPSNRGCSISFPDGTWNEIVSPSRLLHEWSGPSGEVTATVHPDCLAIDDFLIERICTHPEATLPNGRAFQLRPWSAGSRATQLPATLDGEGYGGNIEQRRERGDHATAYWSEFVGGTHQVEFDALFQFRFWPIPMKSWLVSFDAEVKPLPYRVGHLATPSLIPVPDPDAQRILIPIARGHVAKSFLHDRERTDKRDLRDDHETARTDCRLLTPVFSATSQFVGTPDGW
jgi:hypothetical protein